MEAFTNTCLATFPSFSGIEGKLSSMSFNLQNDGTWKNDEMMVNPSVKLSSGGRGCLAWRYQADPIEVSELVLSKLQGMKVSDITAKRKGRRTTITFKTGTSEAVLKVEPLFGDFCTMTVFEKRGVS